MFIQRPKGSLRARKLIIWLLMAASAVTALSVLTYAADVAPDSGCGWTNLTHLDALTRDIRIAGTDMAVTLIYSDYPNYDPIVADGEGMACVDDSARAAVVYLKDYEATKSSASLDKARKLLEFVMHMQTADGDFYNFIYSNLSINRTGPTSRASMAWWAGRAVWSLGLGTRIFKDVDSSFAERLSASLDKTFARINEVRTKNRSNWLINGESDVTSYYILGFLEWYRAKPTEPLRTAIARMSDAVSASQKGTFTQAPFGIIYSNPDLSTWHQWGSLQAHAMAAAAGQFPEQSSKWLKASILEAESWFGDLLINGMIFEMSSRKREYPQIAYSANVVVQSYYELYKATGNTKYGKLAALAAGWFLGNNPSAVTMYYRDTGIGYDGIDGPGRVNRNSGAESTIEALMTFQSIDRLPKEFQTYLGFIYQKPALGTLGKLPEERSFVDSNGNTVLLVRNPGSRSLDITYNPVKTIK